MKNLKCVIILFIFSNMIFSWKLVRPWNNISVDLNEYEKSIQYALAMEHTLLKDWGLALAGEVEENFLGSSENALKYYYI